MDTTAEVGTEQVGNEAGSIGQKQKWLSDLLFSLTGDQKSEYAPLHVFSYVNYTGFIDS